jgi:hypothetical protein
MAGKIDGIGDERRGGIRLGRGAGNDGNGFGNAEREAAAPPAAGGDTAALSTGEKAATIDSRISSATAPATAAIGVMKRYRESGFTAATIRLATLPPGSDMSGYASARSSGSSDVSSSSTVSNLAVATSKARARISAALRRKRPPSSAPMTRSFGPCCRCSLPPDPS